MRCWCIFSVICFTTIVVVAYTHTPIATEYRTVSASNLNDTRTRNLSENVQRAILMFHMLQ